MTAMSIAPAASLGCWHGEIWLTDDVLTDPHAYLDRVAEYSRTRLWPVLVPAGGLGLPPEVSFVPEAARRAVDRHDPQAEAGIAGAVMLANKRPAYRLGLVEANRPADVPARLGRPGMSAILRSWEDRFGATLVMMGAREMMLSVSAPPTELHKALVVANEHRSFCPRIPGTLPQLSRGLIRLRRWHFRWR
ncbi:nucleotide-binding universal stress UspA family protein [Kibdelosporangium banguiense]|uniref:Nucleotide-binding universal stress UspA family protein n=1 Tax=Kibdelosporangium banguiense TaxID=1365924 RepID=A0ABS4TA83_9PSEU|nr:DUF4253 domain-containing protein [Kibdelosporangium banguiense]MBP2321229.1 nucleotide-binding universal stress UspA family protein [Kibdelosporangium banguiense]